jgi:hypothetical protein
MEQILARLLAEMNAMEERIVAKMNAYLERMESHMNVWRKETTAC